MKKWLSHYSPAEWRWGFYDAANSAFTLIVITAFMPVFFKDFVAAGLTNEESTVWWSLFTGISALLLALSSPFLGWLADFGRFSKLFYLRFFAVFGMVFCLSLSFFSQGQILFSLIAYALAFYGFAAANIYYDAMIVDITVIEKRDRVSALGYGIGYLGSTAPFLVVLLLLSFRERLGISSPVLILRFAFILTAIWWLVFSLPLFTGPQGLKDSRRTKGRPRLFASILATMKSILKDREILIFLLAYFLYIDGVDTIISLAIPFGKDIGLKTSDLMIVLLVIQILAAPFALIYGKIADKLGAKKALLIAIGTYVLITFLAFFMTLVQDRYKLGLFWALSILVATAQGGIQSLSRSTFSKKIPKEKATEYFGFYNIFSKFSAILGPFLYATILHFTGQVKWSVLSILVFFIAGGLLLMKTKEGSSLKNGD